MSITELLEAMGPYVWVLFMLLISFVSWLAGKLKDLNARTTVTLNRDKRPEAKRADDAENTPDQGFDLATLLGLPSSPDEAPSRPPQPSAPAERRTTEMRTPRSARPVPPRPRADALPVPRVARRVEATPPPLPPEPQPPHEQVEPAVAFSRVEQIVSTKHPEPARQTTIQSSQPSVRFDLRSRDRLRQGIILAEVLGKPVALRDQDG